MNPQKIAELRDRYDNTSTAEDMEGGTWETDVQDDPMVTTSLRLPKSVLDWVRAEAKTHHTKPTALIRQWIEERQNDPGLTGIAERLARLEHAVFEQHMSLMTPREPSK